MKRVIVYIDGFNLYHSLQRTNLSSFKWLDIKSLVNSKLYAQDQIQDVLFFTALATWSPSKVTKHNNYIGALKLTGVKSILGVFRRKKPRCRKCHQNYDTFEEKRTDVNIAMHMLKDAFEGNVDKIVVVSGDSDLVPPIEMIKEKFPAITVEVHVPIGGKARELMAAADRSVKYSTADIGASKLPDEVKGKHKSYSKPPSW